MKNDKARQFETEIKDLSIFKSKVIGMFNDEFEDKLPFILKLSKNNFIEETINKINLMLKDKFGSDCLENLILKKILANEKEHLILGKYEPILDLIQLKLANCRKGQKLEFRRHCRFDRSTASHSCCGKSDFVTISNNNQKIDYIVCLTCNMPYSSTAILLYCNFCKMEYYSTLQTKKSLHNKELATWEKYHCSAMVNDCMRCINCNKGLFYLDLEKNNLTCDSCQFSADPMSIFWKCYICGEEFNCNAKIYNPLEFKLIKTTINNALVYKTPALPKFPCCEKAKEYYHKKECKGAIYSGEYNKSGVIVCEKCKMMNTEERFIWTCPICSKRFEDKPNQSMFEYEVTACSSKESTRDQGFARKNSEKLNDEEERAKEELEKKEVTKFKTTKKFSEITTGLTNESNLERSPVRRKTYYPNHANLGYLTEVKNVRNIRLISNKINKLEISPVKFDGSINQHSTPSSDIILAGVDKEDRLKEMYKISPLKTGSLIRNKYRKIRNKESVSFNQVDEVLNLKARNIGETEEEFEEVGPVKLGPTKNLKISASCKRIEVVRQPTKSKLLEFNVDDYSFKRQIGEGSFAKIYLAEDSKGTKFCMKKLIANDEIEVKKFSQEYELMHLHSHENILKILGICIRKLDVTTFVIYILMELADTDWGHEIKEREKAKKFYSETDLLKIISQVSLCMAYLQNLNVSHRDIKPQNILRFGNLFKLADFGEAKRIMHLNKMSTIRGTELYMSPQLYNGFSNNLKNIIHDSYKSDVYSLGLCLLYSATLDQQVLFEIRKFIESSQISQMINKKLKNRYSKNFISLLESMLEIDEETRIDFNGINDSIRNLI